MTDYPSIGVRSRSKILAILALTLSVAGYLAWSILDGYRNQEDHQRALAGHAVQDVGNEIAEVLAERRESLGMLAELEGGLLSRLAAEPDNAVLHQRLKDLLDFRFPDFYAYTLADSKGDLVLDDFGEFVGDLCQADLRHFAASGEHRSVIHPGPSAYHFDAMVRWSHQGREGVLFASFVPDALAQWLSHNATTGHQLVLVQSAQPRLIEVTGQGSRDRLQGHNYLDDDDLARIGRLGARAEVADSMWTVVSLPAPGLMDDAWRRTVLLLVGLGAVSLLVVAVAIRLVLREARRAGNAEREQEAAQRELETRVVERTREMRAEKDFADAVLGAAGNVIVVLDLEGRIVRFNRTAELVTGYAFEELQGKVVWEYLIPPERQADVRWVFDSLVHETLIGVYENEWMMRDGSRRLFDWRNTVLRDEAGRITHVIAQGNDITERKDTEVQLRRDREQQAALRGLLEIAHKCGALEEALERCLSLLLSVSWLSLLPKGGVFLVDAERGGLRMAAHQNLSPLERSTCAHLPMGHCLCGRAAATCEMQFTDSVDASHQIKRPGMADHGNYAVPILQDRHLLGVLVLYLPPGFQRDRDREEFVSAAADILAGFISRKRDEEALRASEAKANLILDSAPDAMLVVARDGRITRANDNAVAMFGHARERLLAMKVEDLMPERYRGSHGHIRTRYMEHPEARPMGMGRDLFGLRADGGEFPLEVSLAHLGKDEALQIIVTLVDITQRKQDEIQLRRYAQVVDTSGDLLCLIGRDGRYQVVNPAYAAMFGGTPRGVMGKPVEEVLGPEIYGQIKPHFEAVLEGETRYFSSERVFPDGRRYVLDAEYRPFWLEGEVQGVVASIHDVTEQVEAEEAAQEADRLFRDTMEASFMGIYIIQDAVFRYVNPSYAELFGYTPAELEGHMSPLDLVVPDQREWVAENLTRRSEGEPGRPYELKGLCKDGTVLDILVWGRGIRYKGAPATVGTLLDITDRKRVEEALVESEHLLERAQAMAHVGSWTLDVESRGFEGSAEACHVFGIPSGRIPLEQVFATFHPNGLDKTRSAWEQVLSGASLDVEHQILVDGVSKWVHVKAELQRDTEGSPAIATGMVQDITETRMAQLALEAHRSQLEDLVAERTANLIETEARARLILESTADGLFGMDLEGRFTFLNPAACAMLGYAPETLVGRGVHDVIHHSCTDGSRLDQHACPMLEALRNGKPVRRDDEVFWRVDGTAFPVAYAMQPMHKDGRLVGAVVSFMDITRRREAEAARETALEEAERLARVRSEFLANMSHEIRTPLNAVLGLAQVGLRGSERRKAHDTFARILDSGQLLLGIVNDILDFSKIEAGRLEMEQRQYSPTDVVDRVVAVVAARAYGKGLDFRLEESPGLPLSCLGDELRLSQVLMNLLSNAVKFTETGGITFTARRDGDQLEFRIEDTGIGMSAEQMSRLFTPFEQADGSTTRRFGGTGLGLAISKRLVELMHGQVSVASEPGRGSVFSVRLPVASATDRKPPSTKRRVALLGLAAGEAASFAEALRAWGATVLDGALGGTPAVDVDLVICPEGAAQQAGECTIEQALAQGRQVALAVTPGHAPNDSFQDTVSLLERPLRPRHALAIMESADATPAKAVGGARRLEGVVVLAAEDNEVNRLVLGEMLEEEGAELTCLENGQEAVDQLAQTGPGIYDVFLTDIQMPVMDGYRAARTARELDPDLPVIGITAHAMPEEKARCFAVGMAAHVAKPLDMEILVAAIRQHARRPQGGPRPDAKTGEMRQAPQTAQQTAGQPQPQTQKPPSPDQADGQLPQDDLKVESATMDIAIDWNKLEARFNGKRDFVNKLVKTALDSQAESPRKLREAARQRDYQALAFAAHSLKGMSGNLMADELHVLSARVEMAAKGQEEGALDQAETLARAVERFLELLAERIG